MKKILPNDALIQIELAQTLLNFESDKALNQSIENLTKAKKRESENNKLWYLLSVAYGKNNQMDKSRYASAYSAYLKGDDALAINFIERAKKITKKNSQTWKKLIELENKINLKKNKK